MATKEVSEIHSESCAILEKLYVAKGSPADLDPAFLQEYFGLLQEHLSLEPESVEPEPRAPHTTNARLSQQDRGLIEVVIPSKNEKFLVKSALVAATISGTSQRFGSDRGRGTYVMSSVQGIPNITITTGSAVVAFVGVPRTVQAESGVGEWVSA
ncbi:hypothetical protein HYPSUDRAFT_38389 [Hypholoma sublateritium FD-334 SS-4]|uniref:Uncharacterized protein n=1 Tax=Hypholoma sublateritium (strain FD-334 SS-4) TaxID=945553 RepID=A0A0D2PZD5_HYPSF|nr:hypothetical protein HYPSUDRAFT_38389 [Hypholoma sublateritium FD-334 SS-4]